jgi:hypothetical protein
VSRYGERPCSCGEYFDDAEISTWWPHLPLMTRGREVEDAVPDLPACYRAPIGLMVHGPGCTCPEPP